MQPHRPNARNVRTQLQGSSAPDTAPIHARATACWLTGLRGPGSLEPYELRDQHGWHNCATVIDPFLVGVERPAGRSNDVGLRLSDTPGITLAERCRAVLPPDVQLEKSWYQQRGPDGNSTFAPPPKDYLFEPGHTGCDAWAEWYGPSPSSTSRFYPAGYGAAQLAEEWMEHYRSLPEHYIGPTC